MTTASGTKPDLRTEPNDGWDPHLDISYPPLPRTVTEVSKLLTGDKQGGVPDTPRLIEVITADPMMAVSVLRRVNSAYHGVRRNISNLDKAVALLGFDEVCNIVMTAGMMEMGTVFKTYKQSQIFEQVMKVSIGSAFYAQVLADYLRMRHSETAFSVGLLHAVGRLIFLHNRPHQYERLWEQNNNLIPNAQAEQLIFGFNHPKLGAMAADHWHLPEDMVLIIENQTRPGHLKQNDLRLFAMMLSISIAVTEQLCFNPAEDGISFSGKTALRMLARAMDMQPKEVMRVITKHRKQAKEFVTSMVNQT